jgi:hypothetical protein
MTCCHQTSYSIFSSHPRTSKRNYLGTPSPSLCNDQFIGDAREAALGGEAVDDVERAAGAVVRHGAQRRAALRRGRRQRLPRRRRHADSRARRQLRELRRAARLLRLRPAHRHRHRPRDQHHQQRRPRHRHRRECLLPPRGSRSSSMPARCVRVCRGGGGDTRRELDL